MSKLENDVMTVVRKIILRFLELEYDKDPDDFDWNATSYDIAGTITEKGNEIQVTIHLDDIPRCVTMLNLREHDVITFKDDGALLDFVDELDYDELIEI